MARNGSGVYTPPAASYPAVSGTLIEAAKFNAVIDDISTALTESVAINGQTTITGNLTMGAHKITELANGTAASDACAYGQAGTAAIAETYAATSKATPVDADVLPLSDSEASFGLKKLTWANLKATLKTYLDTLYMALVVPGASGNVMTSNGSAWTSASPAVITDKIQPITASVGSNALTISASALSLDFRSTTLGSGTVTTVSGTPSNLVISSGSTLGTIAATQSRIVVLALNNAGMIELAAVNISGGNDLTETGLISTTSEGGAGAADSANVVYSTTARTNLAYRVIGYIESTQATAGTWATAPSTIQGYGGQAFAAMSSLGYGQTWQNVAGSRSTGTTYYNTTGKPITVGATLSSTVGAFAVLTVNGVAISFGPGSTGQYMSGTWIVPPSASYVMSVSSGTPGILFWIELR